MVLSFGELMFALAFYQWTKTTYISHFTWLVIYWLGCLCAWLNINNVKLILKKTWFNRTTPLNFLLFLRKSLNLVPFVFTPQINHTRMFLERDQDPVFQEDFLSLSTFDQNLITRCIYKLCCLRASLTLMSGVCVRAREILSWIRNKAVTGQCLCSEQHS